MVIAQTYSSLPFRSVTMVGRAGPTIVWSSAPRKSPSMTAKRISIFWRWLRPSAGILVERRSPRVGFAGECFHGFSPSLGLRGRGASGVGRRSRSAATASRRSAIADGDAG